MSVPPYILYMPDIVLEKIFSFLSYDEIAKSRLICVQFNELCGGLLNRGYAQLERRHAVTYKYLKGRLPRRESERRIHTLARYCDILQAVETRISMLNMTYVKYIDLNLICFIPGKVIDELANILNTIEAGHTPPGGTQALLQEFRDLSSMAMEHFEEHIQPRVKEIKDKIQENHILLPADFPDLILQRTKPVLRQHTHDLKRITAQCKKYKTQILSINQTVHQLSQKINSQNHRMKAQTAKLKEQDRKVNDQMVKIKEHENALIEVKKNIDDWEQKYNDLTTELVRARDEILLKSGPSTSTPGPSSRFKSNIKPRTSRILPPNYSLTLDDLERKRKSNLLPDIPIKRNRAPDETRNVDTPKAGPDESKDADKTNFGSLIENIIKTSLSGIKTRQQTRKRKMTEDIDLK